MNRKGKEILNLAEIEGSVSPHSAQVKGALKVRARALKLVNDIEGLARYCGGYVENLIMGEDWAVGREVYPGVEIILAYFREDDEFPAHLQALYSGSAIREIKGEELAMLTISFSNQLLRYLRANSAEAELPQVCYRV